MSRQYREWEDRNHGPAEEEASELSQEEQEREQRDAEFYGIYMPTAEEQESMRQDMLDPALFGDLALPPDLPDEDIPL